MIQRRTFLGSLMTVTGALASGVTIPAASQASRATSKALQTQSLVYSMLDECRMTSIVSTTLSGGQVGYVCEYLHLPKASRDDNDEMKLIKSHLSSMRPVDMRFERRAGELTKLTVWWG